MKKFILTLFFSFIILTTFSQSDTYKYRFIYEGSLAGKSITMRFLPDNNNGDVSGDYYYGNGNAGVLEFEGTYNSSTKDMILTERDSKGSITGYFSGKSQNKMFTGTWTNPDGSRKYNFSLKLVKYNENAGR